METAVPDVPLGVDCGPFTYGSVASGRKWFHVVASRNSMHSESLVRIGLYKEVDPCPLCPKSDDGDIPNCTLSS